MRYFRFFDDHTLCPTNSHTQGELVGRKPLAVSFLQKPGIGKHNGRRAVATRMGQAFAKKLREASL